MVSLYPEFEREGERGGGGGREGERGGGGGREGGRKGGREGVRDYNDSHRGVVLQGCNHKQPATAHTNRHYKLSTQTGKIRMYMYMCVRLCLCLHSHN